MVYTTPNSQGALNYLQLQLGEHWGIVGRTGSGKTVFAIDGLVNYMRRVYPSTPRYIIDSTGDPDLPRMAYAPLQVNGNSPPPFLTTPAYTMIWTPDNARIDASYSAFFDRINDARTPVILIVDEMKSIQGSALASLEALLKQMRKHGGTGICLSQQIANVSTEIFSQLTHFVQFDIGSERYDLAMARSYLQIGNEDQHTPYAEYGFFYRKVRGRFPVKEYSDYRDFFVRRKATHG